MRKYLWIITILVLGAGAQMLKAQDMMSYYSQKPKWSFKKQSDFLDKNRFVNWNQLYFSWQKTSAFSLQKGDNVVSKPFFIKKEKEKEFRQEVYKDLMMIPIDYELTVERLALLNENFRASLLSKLFETNLFELIEKSDQEMISRVKIPFTGNQGLIKTVLDSFYYQLERPLKVVSSSYEGNRYDVLMIEARHLNLRPSLFPRIYTYDKNGKLMLIYSVEYSHWDSIIKEGYAHFVVSEKVANKKQRVFYISALQTVGDLESDIVISREDYLKFFASSISILNLTKGNLSFVIKNNQTILR